ncbi:MAG TPA: class I SAM-dependent methyltransferase, partial [Pyrinomonadaceae bacterium]|nr:class I SAM-dependent methyltransferase [Pyrinomonadaceae bacterium]
MIIQSWLSGWKRLSKLQSRDNEAVVTKKSNGAPADFGHVVCCEGWIRISDRALQEGHFARKQIFSKDWLISWSHRSRFELGLLLAQQFAGKRVLDYGCGDGTFLAMLMAQPTAPAKACGAELLSDNVKNCRARLGHHNIDFVLIDELNNDEHAGAYDAVICMEVLEHIVDVESVLDRFVHLLAPSGKLLLSVPVETGLPL